MIGTFFTLNISCVPAFCSDFYSGGDQTKVSECKKQYHFEEAGIINPLLAPEKVKEIEIGGSKMGHNRPGFDMFHMF